MGNKKEHLSKAEHNNSFLFTFDFNKTKYLDWAVVSIFYTALHYIDAYLAKIGLEEFQNHGTRHRLVEKHIPLILKEYRILYRQSLSARYHVNYETTAINVRLYNDKFLFRIKTEILSLLK